MNEIPVASKMMTRTEQLVCRIGELIGEIDVERMRRMSAEHEARRAREKAEWMHKQAVDTEWDSEVQLEMHCTGGSMGVRPSWGQATDPMDARNQSGHPDYANNDRGY